MKPIHNAPSKLNKYLVFIIQYSYLLLINQFLSYIKSPGVWLSIRLMTTITVRIVDVNIVYDVLVNAHPVGKWNSHFIFKIVHTPFTECNTCKRCSQNKGMNSKVRAIPFQHLFSLAGHYKYKILFHCSVSISYFVRKPMPFHNQKPLKRFFSRLLSGR